MNGLSLFNAMLGAAGMIYGYSKSAEYGNEARDKQKRQQQEEDVWYNKKRPQDYLLRSDAQATIKKQYELADEMDKRAKKTNIVAGGTDEALAMQKAGSNKSISDTYTGVAARASDYNDRLEENHRAKKFALEQQEITDLQQRSAAMAQAGSQLANTAINNIGNASVSKGQNKADFYRALSDAGKDWTTMSQEDIDAAYKVWMGK